MGEQASVPCEKRTPGGISKSSPGGANKVYRAEKVPMGEQASVPCGNGGTGTCTRVARWTRAESLPLGCTRAESAPRRTHAGKFSIGELTGKTSPGGTGVYPCTKVHALRDKQYVNYIFIIEKSGNMPP